MPEKQNIEYKESWHDEYLKTICAFANAQGGKLYIGIDDKGNIKGISNATKLMEDIPSKVRNYMGILSDVNLLDKAGLAYLEIGVYRSEVAISYKGVYYYRTGSTTQELAGAHLAEFLQRKSGKTWDDCIEAQALIDDIDEGTIRKFTSEAKDYNRLPEDGSSSLLLFLEKLRLTDKGQLKRAAILLFGKDVRRFYPNAFVKIVRIGDSETDLLFQEVIEKNIIQTVEDVLALIRSKFLVRTIKIEDIRRVEKDEYPIVAIREMLLNALVHERYINAPVQIKIYNDKISIWNDGLLPDGLSPKDLKQPHASVPRNPIIADVCFKGGYIELWGSGTLRIIEACKNAGLPQPEMKEDSGGFLVTIHKYYYTEKTLKEMGLNERQVKAVHYLENSPTLTNSTYKELFKVSRNIATKDLASLVQKGIIIHSGGRGPSSYYHLINNY